MQSSDWKAKAVAWELMAVSFRYPSEELVQAILQGDWMGAVQDVLREFGIDGSSTLDELRHTDQDAKDDEQTLLKKLRIEATKLFIGAPYPEVPAYEGLWRSHQKPEEVLLFVNRYALEVERFCHDAGFDHPDGTNEPLDHVAAEFELLEYLSLAAAGVDVHEDNAEGYPGGSPEESYRLFKTEHVDTWIPQFAQAVSEKASHPFYRAASETLRALVPIL